MSPNLQTAIWQWAAEADIPILGICYGFQEIAHALGGVVEAAPEREFGHAQLAVGSSVDALLEGFANRDLKVWMSHGDKITALPPGFAPIASTTSCEFAAVAGRTPAGGRLWGLQFHPEVSHTPDGAAILANFVIGIARCERNWTMDSFLEGEWRLVVFQLRVYARAAYRILKLSMSSIGAAAPFRCRVHRQRAAYGRPDGSRYRRSFWGC